MKHVAIHGVPRSGTTWLGEIFNSSPHVRYKYQPLFSYKFKGRLSTASSAADIQKFFESIGASEDDFVDQIESRKAGQLPIFEKEKTTHVVYKEVRYHHILHNMVERCPEVKLCLLVRNPFSVINSWLKAPREFRADLGWKAEDEWRFAQKKNQGLPEEFNGFERWKQATLMFLGLEKRFPESVVVSNYRTLLEDTEIEVKRLFQFCDLPVVQQTLNFIEAASSVSSENAYSVFRKSASDDQWRKELPTEIAKAIAEDLSGTTLESFIPQGVAL